MKYAQMTLLAFAFLFASGCVTTHYPQGVEVTKIKCDAYYTTLWEAFPTGSSSQIKASKVANWYRDQYNHYGPIEQEYFNDFYNELIRSFRRREFSQHTSFFDICLKYYNGRQHPYDRIFFDFGALFE